MSQAEQPKGPEARYGATDAERETILRTSDADEVWHVWAAEGSKMCKRLLRLYDPDMKSLGGFHFTIPLKGVLIRHGPRKKRLTEEAKKKLAERLQDANKSRTMKFPNGSEVEFGPVRDQERFRGVEGLPPESKSL